MSPGPGEKGPAGTGAAVAGRARRLTASLLARLPWRVVRVLVPLAVVAGIALAVRAALAPRLSAARLVDALVSSADAALAFLTSGVGAGLSGFVMGAGVGWFAAVRWLGHRFRSRSLLLLDPRRADMSFVEGVDHVRAQSGSPKPGVHQAATSIVEAAARGRLSLWQQSGTNVLRRVSPRQVRQARTRLAIFAGEERGEERAGGVEFRLFRNEVESLWPTRRQLTIGHDDRAPLWSGIAPSLADGLRRTAEKFTKLK